MSPPAAPAPRPVSVPARRGSRASGQRAFSPSFRRNEHGLVVSLSPLRQTRSPRQHSHWSPFNRAQPRIEPVNPNRTARLTRGSLDHLVGEREQIVGDIEAKRLGGG